MIKQVYSEKVYVLQMGQLQASMHPSVITCFGLGSCVGLFLYDRISKIGGGAHIMFATKHASDQSFPESFYAACAIDELIRKMADLGANPAALRAKVVGGANLLGMGNFSTGKQNTETIERLLADYGIYIAAKDIGGTIGRTAAFYLANGQVKVSTQSGNYLI